MEKVKITVNKIVNTKPDKYGVSVRVKASEYGDNKIFMISTKNPESIKEGGVYEGEATLWKKDDAGTEWMSWRWPKKEDVNGKQLEQILNNQAKIMLMLTQIGQAVVPQPKPEVEYPEYEGPTDFDGDDGLDQLNPDEYVN